MPVLMPMALTSAVKTGFQHFLADLDVYRSRFVYKPLDALLTAGLRPKRSAASDLLCIGRIRSANYEKVASAANLIDAVLPGTARRILSYLLRPARLPVTATRVHLLGFGSGATVFLLDVPAEQPASIVLKVYRRSLGKRLAALIEQAEALRGKHKMLSAWYARCDVVVPVWYTIVHGPLLGLPGVACFQPYIDGEKLDIFEDVSDDDLIKLIKEDELLRKAFADFVRRTIELMESKGLCPDLTGRGNLLLFEKEGRRGLRLIDYGIFDLAGRKNIGARAYGRLTERVGRLERICKAIDDGVR